MGLLEILNLSILGVGSPAFFLSLTAYVGFLALHIIIFYFQWLELMRRGVSLYFILLILIEVEVFMVFDQLVSDGRFSFQQWVYIQFGFEESFGLSTFKWMFFRFPMWSVRLIFIPWFIRRKDNTLLQTLKEMYTFRKRASS